MTTASAIADEYQIGCEAMEMIYLSKDPYHDTFDKLLDIWRYDLSQHATVGLSFLENNG
jgi:hypothetical protein